MPPPPRHTPAPGFTLVETACVLCVAAVLATLAWPAIGALIHSRQLDGLASALGADLRFARSEAVVRNEPVRFTVHAGHGADGHGSDGTCWLVHTGPATDCTCTAGCTGTAQLLRKTALPTSDTVRLDAPAASLHFDPQLGTCTPAGTFALVAASGRAVHQIVSVMGRVRACSPQAQVAGHAAC